MKLDRMFMKIQGDEDTFAPISRTQTKFIRESDTLRDPSSDQERIFSWFPAETPPTLFLSTPQREELHVENK